MSTALLIEQLLNGLQFGVMLFLMAAGLTLIFGVMGLINLAHGSLYMIGAFACAAVAAATGSFWLGLVASLVGGGRRRRARGSDRHPPALRPRPSRPGAGDLRADPDLLGGHALAVRFVSALSRHSGRCCQGAVQLPGGGRYPLYRLAIIGVGIVVAIGLYLLISRTRLGMRIRAGESDREMIGALGVDIRTLYTVVFALGAALAGLAGALVGALQSVQVGMGEPVLILAFVVIVIGGIGSIKGALIGAVLVGIVDTMGRFLLPKLLAALHWPGAGQRPWARRLPPC